jgi:CBS domain-containing protein
MRINDILETKGSRVIGLPPTAKVPEAIRLMQENNVGSVIIQDLHHRLLGVLSERDILFAIARRGILATNMYVTQLMRVDTPVATVDDKIVDVMWTITSQRARHLAVVDGDTDMVVGVVSIGDVVKARLAEKAAETAVLQDLARARLIAA